MLVDSDMIPRDAGAAVVMEPRIVTSLPGLRNRPPRSSVQSRVAGQCHWHWQPLHMAQSCCSHCLQTFALTAVKKDGTLDMGLKSTYSSGNYSVVSTISQAGKVGAAAPQKEPGLGPACVLLPPPPPLLQLCVSAALGRVITAGAVLRTTRADHRKQAQLCFITSEPTLHPPSTHQQARLLTLWFSLCSTAAAALLTCSWVWLPPTRSWCLGWWWP